LKTNDFLQAMLQASQNGQSSQAVSYIGKTVTSSGAQADLVNGAAIWSYTASADAPNTVISIRDEAGQVVYRQATPLTAGTDQLAWDGTTLDGRVLTSGKFTLTIESYADNGAYVPVTTEVGGVVTAVDLSGPEPVLLVNGTPVPLSQVTTVQETPSA